MRYFYAVFFFLVVATISILGPRGSKSTRPPLEIFPDMDRQPRLKPQAESVFFLDGRVDRPRVPGTVAKGSFIEDAYFASGRRGEEFGRGIPVPITHELMELGREKYAIFCVVCHGETGDGNGITKSYKMTATPSYHDDRLRQMPEGEIYQTIVWGKNNMGPYGSKLTLAERWAVVVYLRALQRSQNAAIDDVPVDRRGELGR